MAHVWVPQKCPVCEKVVEPRTLLSFYSNTHSSDNCWAVLAAKKLTDAGISPLGRPELVTRP